MKPGDVFPYEFIQVPPGAGPEFIETDVVIIGSGCGGGVSAKNIAEAGNNVIVVEKSYYWSPDHFPMSEADGWGHLFTAGAYLASKFIESLLTMLIANKNQPTTLPSV
jgi:siroheme synthase (precorrin-2 oxidase/ferrochelatase)